MRLTADGAAEGYASHPDGERPVSLAAKRRAAGRRAFSSKGTECSHGVRNIPARGGRLRRKRAGQFQQSGTVLGENKKRSSIQIVLNFFFYPDRRDKLPRFGREKPGDFTLFVQAGGTLSGKRVRTGCDAPQGKWAICPGWRLAMRRIGQRSAGCGAEYGRRMPQNAPRRRALLRRGGDKVPRPARGSGTGAGAQRAGAVLRRGRGQTREGRRERADGRGQTGKKTPAAGRCAVAAVRRPPHSAAAAPSSYPATAAKMEELPSKRGQGETLSRPILTS